MDGGEIMNSDGYQAPEVTINPKLEIYDLKIGDKQVTSDNADDILGDGTLSYDPSAEILEICGDISDNNNIENNIQDLIIFVRTDITLQSFISTYKNVVVSGPGTLNIITPGYNSLFAENSNIYLEEANVDVSGTWGISGVTSNENLIIKKSYVHAYGQYGAIFNFNSISLEDCVIIQPEGGYVDGGTIVDANGNVAKEVTIIPTPEKYDLKICGQQVTSLNSNDVLGDGVFKYDDDNNTLTVNGDVTYNGCIIYNEIQDLTIDVTGNSTLSSTSATIITEKNITFKGNGILTLTSSKDCGLYILDSTVTIENLSLESVGKWGIAGYPNDEHLIVRNSEVHASGRVCAICDFSSISIDGCEIVLPEGGYVDGGYIADANGSVATEVIIAKQGDIITGYEYEGSFWATYFNSTVSKKADGNTTVYMATLSADNSELALNEVADRIIPAGQAVILKSSEKSILLTKTSETSSGNFEGNCLSGCDWPTDVPTDQGTIYTMNEEHEQLGFYRFAGKKLGAHKAYLAIRSNGAPTRITFDMDEATGIESIEDLNIYDLRFDAEGYYNIDGRHFNGNPTAPGIYIVNGRKVLITGRTQR